MLHVHVYPKGLVSTAGMYGDKVLMSRWRESTCMFVCVCARVRLGGCRGASCMIHVCSGYSSEDPRLRWQIYGKSHGFPTVRARCPRGAVADGQ